MFVVLMALIVLVFTTTVGAYTMYYRDYVLLPANKNEVHTDSFSGNYGKGELMVAYGSAGNAKLLLQTYTGTGYTTLTTISAAPGATDATNVWGRDDHAYEFRIIVRSDPIVLIGNPGRIADGYIFTGFEE